jgi:hypothetical protein
VTAKRWFVCSPFCAWCGADGSAGLSAQRRHGTVRFASVAGTTGRRCEVNVRRREDAGLKDGVERDAG